MNKKQMEKYIREAEVQIKVRQILSLDTEKLYTTQQIAEMYEVKEESVRNIVRSCEPEFAGDSINNDNIILKNCALYTKDVVKKVGMMLEGSEVAKLLRTTILDMYFGTIKEPKYTKLNKEQLNELMNEAFVRKNYLLAQEFCMQALKKNI